MCSFPQGRSGYIAGVLGGMFSQRGFAYCLVLALRAMYLSNSPVCLFGLSKKQERKEFF